MLILIRCVFFVEVGFVMDRVGFCLDFLFVWVWWGVVLVFCMCIVFFLFKIVWGEKGDFKVVVCDLVCVWLKFLLGFNFGWRLLSVGIFVWGCGYGWCFGYCMRVCFCYGVVFYVVLGCVCVCFWVLC